MARHDETKKIDMIYDLLKDHMSESRERHDAISEIIRKNSADIASSKAKHDSASVNIRRLYIMVLAALGVNVSF